MVNAIWMFMLLVGFIAAAAQGRIEAVTEAVFEGAKTGVSVSFGLISVMVFWLGMMRIAEDAGLLKRLAKALGPIVRYLFPDVPRNHPALGFIMSNMSANLLGLGNAATPMGIRAMQELQKLNPSKDTATPAMCTLLAINTSSITLIPTTLIAIRMNFNSANPAEIVGTTLLATIVATFAAIFADRWYRRRDAKRPPPHQFKSDASPSAGAQGSETHTAVS
ncbi:nucleoside recognition protein [Paenibacillus alvei]|uniref:Nucleoside recognition protein n=1 Tax=Paenibacillus alvei TaxID=44250 RepID=A0ABT4GSY2_PAEAL|nr:nucleoside recognition domain-containing protein [Paenibacillus alvei]MCY7487345.1 nucleoside recognition protein [Paenibacillus alvei]MCY9759784.1 nucleoside recognition protein [Paenibacillus alvei]MCY9767995.1 nucleoside recognition protein [Paenibacillus alvei]